MNLTTIRTTSKLDGTVLPTANRLEATEVINGMVVVKATGEILSEYTSEAISTATHGEATFHRLTNILPQDFTSTNQMTAWLDAAADKRRMILKNDVTAVHNQSAGAALREGSPVMFTTTEHRKLDRIVMSLSYRNILIDTTEAVAEILGVDITNMQRDLKGLVSRGIVKFWNARSGMAKGMVKIIINPILGWKHESSHFETSRATATQAWYAQDSIDLVGSTLAAAEVIVESIVVKATPVKAFEEDDLFPNELVSVYVGSQDGVQDSAYKDLDPDTQSVYTSHLTFTTHTGADRHDHCNT